jgi:hypothetical protein
LKSSLILEATAGRTGPTLKSLRGGHTFDHPASIVARGIRVVFQQAGKADRTATVSVFGVPVVTQFGVVQLAPIVHDSVATDLSIARNLPLEAVATAGKTRVRLRQDAIGSGVAEHFAEGSSCAADVLVLRLALFALVTILGAVARLEPEG